MNKIFLVFAGLLLTSIPCFAGNIDLSANAGLYTAPGGVGTSTMYGVAASQNITDNVSVRLSMHTTTYTVNNQSTTFIPVSLDLIYSQPMPIGLTPYAGAGLSYNSTTTNGNKSETAGAQAEIGIRYSFGGFSAGIEYRYIIPDLNDTSLSSSAFNGYATGSIAQSISF